MFFPKHLEDYVNYSKINELSFVNIHISTFRNPMVSYDLYINPYCELIEVGKI